MYFLQKMQILDSVELFFAKNEFIEIFGMLIFRILCNKVKSWFKKPFHSLFY